MKVVVLREVFSKAARDTIQLSWKAMPEYG